jgi:hypothetical protein
VTQNSRGLLALCQHGLLAQCQAWPTAMLARDDGRLSTGRSHDAGVRKAAAARCMTVTGDAAVLSNGGALGSITSVWTPAPGDGSGHGE